MVEIHPYLCFDGHTEQAFQLYQQVLGGSITSLQRFDDVESEIELDKIGSGYKNHIIHIVLRINEIYTIMGCEILPNAPTLSKGNSAIQVSINLSDNTRAKKIFDTLSLDGSVTMPFDIQFWGSWYGMLTDKFGNQWIVDSPT